MKYLHSPKVMILLSCISWISAASQSESKSYLSNRYSLERIGSVNPGTNTVLPGLPLPPPDLIGDPFLQKHYGESNFLLYTDRSFGGLYAKLDLLHDLFYIKTNDGVRVLEGPRVKSFTFRDSLTNKSTTYINGHEFKGESGVSLSGFFEVLFDAPISLIKKTEAHVVKSNFNATLNVGKRDDQIKKTTEYYYLKDGAAALVPAKSLTKIFGEKKPEVDRFIKINNLNPKDERHLILIFEHYNGLSSS